MICILDLLPNKDKRVQSLIIYLRNGKKERKKERKNKNVLLIVKEKTY